MKKVAVNSAGPWNPDGSEISFTESNDRPSVGVSQWDILALALPPMDESPRPVLAEPTFNETYPALSPDGRWLAYASDESGSYEVYVRSYPSLDGKQQISRDGGVMPVSSRNGDELFYQVPRPSQREQEVMMAVDMVPSTGTPRELFRGDFGMGTSTSYAVAPDGRSF